MIKLVIVLTTLILLSFSIIPLESRYSIRKDFECEIFERDYYIKDCYRVRELNVEDREMIAGILNAR